MSEQMILKRKIEAMKFASWELHLFLDSHPSNMEAAKKLKEYEEKIKRSTLDYERQYGKLFPTSTDTSRYEWISSPWPWEKEDINHVDL